MRPTIAKGVLSGPQGRGREAPAKARTYASDGRPLAYQGGAKVGLPSKANPKAKARSGVPQGVAAPIGAWATRAVGLITTTTRGVQVTATAASTQAVGAAADTGAYLPSPVMAPPPVRGLAEAKAPMVVALTREGRAEARTRQAPSIATTRPAAGLLRRPARDSSFHTGVSDYGDHKVEMQGCTGRGPPRSGTGAWPTLSQG